MIAAIGIGTTAALASSDLALVVDLAARRRDLDGPAGPDQ
jgi:hypothetical protein